MKQIVAATDARPEQCYFWATHNGAELDLLVVRGNERLGFEIKPTSTPKVTASLRISIDTLGLDAATVVHAGAASFPLAAGIEAVSARELGVRRW